MTAINNLPSILQHGLLSHNEAHRLSLVTDISDSTVQSLRSNRKIDNIELHDYVPLYFSPRNPMLYVRREIQHQIVILGVDPCLLFESTTIFSDGNAAAIETKFYRGVSLLDNLPWDIINAVYWNDIPDGKRIKCAEILVYPKIDIKNILKIFCYSLSQVEEVRAIIDSLSRDVNIVVERNRILYFS